MDHPPSYGTRLPEHAINVFFDASSLITVGAPPGNAVFQRVADLVRYGFITVVTTDLTKTEMTRHHTDVAFSRLRPLLDSRSRRLAAKYLNIEIPEISEDDARNQIRRDIVEGVEKMFHTLQATTLDIDQVRPSVIFEHYDIKAGVFVAQNKKNQFPDAFVFECLKAVASEDTPLLIVAGDPDFKEPVNRGDHLSLVDSISGLFDVLGLLVDEPDPDLEPFLYHELLDNADFLAYAEFQDDDLDGYRVAASCRDIQFDGINAFQQVDENAPLLISVDVTVELDVEMEHNDGGPPEVEPGRGSISFYASVVNGENDEPKSISDLRVFHCSLDWGHISLLYMF